MAAMVNHMVDIESLKAFSFHHVSGFEWLMGGIIHHSSG
jgi:hypothetical protein